MKNLILTALFLCFLNSCTKDSASATPADTLPPITATGANTAGCIINGKIIIPKNGTNPTSGQAVDGLVVQTGSNFDNIPYGNHYCAMTFANLKDKGNSYWIYVHLNNVLNGVGNYTVGQSNAEFWSSASNNPQILVRETLNGVSGKTFLSSPNSGTIIITKFDYTNRIISGIFSATLYNQTNTSEIIQVSDGRFDLKI